MMLIGHVKGYQRVLKAQQGPSLSEICCVSSKSNLIIYYCICLLDPFGCNLLIINSFFDFDPWAGSTVH